MSVAVSLIAIAYRERLRAPDAIRALLGQRTSTPFEVILVDDGSDDGTAEAVADAVGTDPRLRIVRLPENRGRGAARAAGLEAAAGTRAIGFVDADTMAPPDWLERCMAALPGHAGVGGLVVPDGDTAAVTRLTGARPRALPGSRAVTGNNVLFDAAILREIGFDPTARLGEDFRLVTRMEQAGHRLARVPGLCVEHREEKSFAASLRWLYASGVDATRLFATFRVVRAPDLAHAALVGATLAGCLGAAAGHPRALLAVPAVAGGIAAAHAATRFAVRPSPARFAAAAVLDAAGVGCYLAGRMVGLAALATGPR